MYAGSLPQKRPRVDTKEDIEDPTFVPGFSEMSSEFPSNSEVATRRREGRKQRLSCAECRRLKLKCDRVFPCKSCTKRGCAEICPTGSLTSGKGSRFILANTEQLHTKIMQMSDRIRQLEEALEHMQAAHSNQAHPLLRLDLLAIKTTLELQGPQPSTDYHHGTSNGAQDPPATRGQPASPPHSEEEAAQSPKGDKELNHNSACAQQSPISRPPSDPPWELPEDIVRLSRSFPVAWSENLSMRQRIRDFLPSRENADYLCQQARQNALWQYDLDPTETFFPNMIHYVYTVPLQSLCPRRLSLVFIILAIGCRVDLKQPPDSPFSETYHRLARVALCEVPLLSKPNYDLLCSLFYMAWYLLIFCEEHSSLGYAWGIIGVAVKGAQLLGFHRDKHSKLFPEEVQGRRMFFWELLNLDARVALCLGRPPSISMKHVECKRPSYVSIGPAEDNDMSYHEWKHGFYQNCLSPVIDALMAAETSSYAVILELDKTIREYRVPPSLDLFKGVFRSKGAVMQSTLAATCREIALLQLHRSYFTQAVTGSEPFTLRHKYAPSVVATYRSARQLISAIETAHSLEPELSARFLMLCFNTISGAVALCLLVSRAPSASLAPFALRELERVCRLFANISGFCPKAPKALPLLAKLTEKSRRTYMQWLTEEGSHLSQSHSDSFQGRNSAFVQSERHMQIMAESENSTDPFENVHPCLVQCLAETRAQIAPPIQEPSAFTSGVASRVEWQNLDDQSPGSLSQTMVDWYMGNNLNVTNAVAPYSASVMEDLSDMRVPNHQTFNLDFGDVTYDLNNQSWMSWF